MNWCPGDRISKYDIDTAHCTLSKPGNLRPPRGTKWTQKAVDRNGKNGRISATNKNAITNIKSLIGILD
jgi:hypothetical protein